MYLEQRFCRMKKQHVLQRYYLLCRVPLLLTLKVVLFICHSNSAKLLSCGERIWSLRMTTRASDGRAFSLVLHRKTLVKLFCLAMFADQTYFSSQCQPDPVDGVLVAVSF